MSLKKEEKMPEHEIKTCQRCGKTFECKVGNITQCQCYEVKLTYEETQKMREEYDECLCAACMLDLQIKYRKEQIQKS
ncbi:cysteine-rich CWC family protein [Flammeovirga sp. SJP92]|uniref:cysteine-rich CWC family protein n=1 Tax=Flammeovirga sp. SJP92 TaxID=1775430 RepID=UPI0020A2AC80|nr:cysteine-rich CWC family protein [Flammeovirga sp. SJP92]